MTSEGHDMPEDLAEMLAQSFNRTQEWIAENAPENAPENASPTLLFSSSVQVAINSLVVMAAETMPKDQQVAGELSYVDALLVGVGSAVGALLANMVSEPQTAMQLIQSSLSTAFAVCVSRHGQPGSKPH